MSPRTNRPWLPAYTGMVAAVALFLAYIPRWLVSMSPMGGSFAFDYFTLPRCGLAIRNATNVFTSSADYDFGYFATNWASHPMLCVVLGVPFSHIPPWPGFWISNALYLCVQLFILHTFGTRLAPATDAKTKVAQHVTFAALGFFFPWILNYHLGQYHIIFVLALALALRGNVVTGFTMSALGKPALAPAALTLLFTKRWKDVAKIVLLCVAGYVPFLLFHFDDQGKIVFGVNRNFVQFLEIASLYSRHTVRGWDQELGWSKVLDEWITGDHYPLRLTITGLCAVGGGLMARRNLPLGIAFASLWFFFSYGRIHEYHYASFVPILAWAATQPGFSPIAVCVAAVGMALPTVWPLLVQTPAFVQGKGLVNAIGREQEPFLFWAWMLHRPLVVAYIAALCVRAWWVLGKCGEDRRGEVTA